MKKTYKKSVEYQAIQLVLKSRNAILLRKNFVHLGGYRQVSRALKKLVEKKMLVRIGLGVYAKSFQSKYLDEPLIQHGFDIASRIALDKLGVEWEPGSAEQAYNSGASQQVPTHNIVRLKSRFRRKLSYSGREIIYEGTINAR